LKKVATEEGFIIEYEDYYKTINNQGFWYEIVVYKETKKVTTYYNLIIDENFNLIRADKY